MSENEFPTPDGFETAEHGDRPGDPLYPGEHTIVDRDNEPLTEGEELQVWFETYTDGHGRATITGTVLVIQAETHDAEEEEEENSGDVYAIPSHQDPTEASRVYRLAGNLSTITSAAVIPRPTYNPAAGELTITRIVNRQGRAEKELLEARSLGRQEYWGVDVTGDL